MKILITILRFYQKSLVMFHYLVKEDEFLPVKEIDESGLDALSSEVRREMLERASSGKVKVSDLVEEMSMDRQTIYYHMEKLQVSGLLKSEGSRPKTFETDTSAYYFRPGFVEPEENPLMLENVPEILKGFVENRKIRARIVVGAPYPHGKYDRRHKTAYKAGEISAILGNYGRRRKQLIHTDTELDKNERLADKPLISVAGPLVNTLSNKINSKMPAKFTESHDRIITEGNSYTGDEKGLIARSKIDGKERIMVAGLFGLGTSAAIYALANKASQLGEKGAVVEGYGTKHNIEEVEIAENL
jgi:DNA-binding transcriptional ArsR family regulator